MTSTDWQCHFKAWQTSVYCLTEFIADLVHYDEEFGDDGLLAEFDDLCTVMETAKMRC